MFSLVPFCLNQQLKWQIEYKGSHRISVTDFLCDYIEYLTVNYISTMDQQNITQDSTERWVEAQYIRSESVLGGAIL